MERASFEHQKTIEDFGFLFNPNVPKAKILDLATCAFVDKRENILLVGQTGVGKSHIGQALGHRACMAGHHVVYCSAQQMLGQLRASRSDNTYERKLLRFTKPDLLIIDDLGLRPLQRDEPMDLYEVIRHRYERASTIIPSNRSIEEWPPLFHDELLAGAAMDRLLHHGHVVEIEGASDAAAGTPRPLRRDPGVTSAELTSGGVDPERRPRSAAHDRVTSAELGPITPAEP